VPAGSPRSRTAESYTQEELDHAKVAVDQQIAAYQKPVDRNQLDHVVPAQDSVVQSKFV